MCYKLRDKINPLDLINRWLRCYCGSLGVVRNDSYSRSRWFEKKEISNTAISFFPLSLSSVAFKSHSLVKFSALFSGPNGRFLLVGCDSYITPLVTRTSSCFLQLRLKVNLSGGGALQHPVLCIQCASETHTRSLSLSLSLALSLCLSLVQSQAEDRGKHRRVKALFIYCIFPIFRPLARRWLSPSFFFPPLRKISSVQRTPRRTEYILSFCLAVGVQVVPLFI